MINDHPLGLPLTHHRRTHPPPDATTTTSASRYSASSRADEHDQDITVHLYTDDPGLTRVDTVDSASDPHSHSHAPPQAHARRWYLRPRSTISHHSTHSAAPSLAQTVVSMFCTNDEEDYDDEYPVGSGPIYLPLSSEDGHSYWDGEEEARERWGRLHAHGQAQMGRWRRYFRPLTRRA
ncbi:hypothetical protein H0H92_006316 [Tricholoma furcatifolium]|nr:hypothetical protein H0H92_006316 [Tricholoma furcatifolium]